MKYSQLKTPKIIAFLLVMILTFGCKQKSDRQEPDFYKNLYTNEIYDKIRFANFGESLFLSVLDTTQLDLLDTVKVKAHIDSLNIRIHFHFDTLICANDSIIQPFKYDVQVGNEYIVRADSYEKIGMKISPRKFQTINGDSIQIGGEQDKPALINFWFVGCRGCIAEIPALNRLQEQYADKVNFYAMTFELEHDVLRFLKKKKFNFTHIANVESFIKEAGTKPYPENIFIGKDGCIKYVEGGLPDSDSKSDSAIKYFESLINNLLEE